MNKDKVASLDGRRPLFLEWENPIPLVDGSDQNLIYVVDPERLPKAPGIYVFGRRRRNDGFEALNVGKADNIRGRVWGHRKNLPLMIHLKNARLIEACAWPY